MKISTLAATLTLSAFTQAAWATAVTVTNTSSATYCLASQQIYSEGENTRYSSEGWTCLAPREVTTLTVGLSVYHLAVVSPDGATDYVHEHPMSPNVTRITALPPQTTESYLLDVIRFGDDSGYSYSYAFGDGAATNWRRVTAYEDLDIILKARGFKSYEAWYLDGSVLGPTHQINLIGENPR